MGRKISCILVILLVSMVSLPSISPVLANLSVTISTVLNDVNKDGFKDVIFTAVNSIGSPVADIDVEIYSQDMSVLIYRGKTASDGQLIVYSLPPGQYKWVASGQEGEISISPWEVSVSESEELVLMSMLMEAGPQAIDKCRAFTNYIAEIVQCEDLPPESNSEWDESERLIRWYGYADELQESADRLRFGYLSDTAYDSISTALAALKVGWVYYGIYRFQNMKWVSDSVFLHQYETIKFQTAAGSVILSIICISLDIYQVYHQVTVLIQDSRDNPQYSEEIIFELGISGLTIVGLFAQMARGIANIFTRLAPAPWQLTIANWAMRITLFVQAALLIIELWNLANEYQEYGDVWAFLSSPEIILKVAKCALLAAGIAFGIWTYLTGIAATASWVPYVGWAIAAACLIVSVVVFVWEAERNYEEQVKTLKAQMSNLLTTLINTKEAIDNTDFQRFWNQIYYNEKLADAIAELSYVSTGEHRYSLMSKYYHLKYINKYLKMLVENAESLKKTGDLDNAIRTALYWQSDDGSKFIHGYANGVNSTIVTYGEPLTESYFTCNATIKYSHKRADGTIQDGYDFNTVEVINGEVVISHNIVYTTDQWTLITDKWYGDWPFEKDAQGNYLRVILNLSDTTHPLDFDYVFTSAPEDNEGILDVYEQNAKFDIKNNGWYFHYKFYPHGDEWCTRPIFGDLDIPKEWIEDLQSSIEIINPRLKAISWAAGNLTWLREFGAPFIPFHIEVEPEFSLKNPGGSLRVKVTSNYRGFIPLEEVELSVNLLDPYGQMIFSRAFIGELDSNNEYSAIFEWAIPEDSRGGLYWVSVDTKAQIFGVWVSLLDDMLKHPICFVTHLDIIYPRTESPASAGDPQDPTAMYISLTGLPFSADFNGNIEIKVGNKIVDEYEIVDRYFIRFGILTLKVTPPKQESEGVFDLNVTVVAFSNVYTALEEDSVQYTKEEVGIDPIRKALEWLRTKQRSDGSWYGYWGGYTFTGVTSLVALAFLNAGYDENDATVRKAIDFILNNVHSDGSIYSRYYSRTYETSLALITLVATHNPAYSEIIEKAKNWLIQSQWDEDCLWGSRPKDDWYYGGFGYGYYVRPDLSNTQFALLALDAAGVPKDHPVWTKAQVFLHRCQNINFAIKLNIEGEEYVVKPFNIQGGYDGGFIYHPGRSLAGDQKSYGSMTAAGLWCLLLSGVEMDDPRVVAAIDWIRKHHSWDGNPGMSDPTSGQYYYYLSMSKALTMTGLSTIDGHDWYRELYDKLVSLQRAEGYWVNTNSWAMEGVSEYVTACAVLSLQTRLAVPKEQRLSYLTFILRSNAYLRIYDPEGTPVGYDYALGAGENQLPTAIYSGPLTDPQFIVIVNPKPGTYTIELVGHSEGLYELTIQGRYGEEITDEFECSGFIKPNELHGTKAAVTSIVGPIDIYASPPQFEKTIDDIPPETVIVIGEPKYIDPCGNIFVTSETPLALIAEDNVGGTGVASTFYHIYNDTYATDWVEYSGPFVLAGFDDGRYSIEYYSIDNIGNIEPTNIHYVYLDNSGPEITIENPPIGWALQDGVTFIVSSIDPCGTRSLNFSIREAGGDEGIPVGFEDMPATYNETTGKWELFFDTLQLPDGFYVVLVSAEDNLGHISTITVPYSIRNWAVLELLPSSKNNKAGRTMPVKFALRVAASVDPNQPFVYNEELTIKIYATDNPTNILQTSTFGDTARDYRINTLSEHYITNFKTLKKPKTYTVEVWRKDMLIGSFQFETNK